MGKKTEFLIVDFWQNDFGKQTEDRVPVDVPLLIRLFNTRVEVLERTRHEREGEQHRQANADCRAMIARIPTESFQSARFGMRLRVLGATSSGRTKGQTVFRCCASGGPLLRFVSDVDVAAETFTHKVEQLRCN